MQTESTIPQWAELLKGAVNEPGRIHAAYSRFHNYSMGNQILAMFQCANRGIDAGPIATFMRWKELGRHVKKGEKALTLLMPITGKRTAKDTDEAGNDVEREIGFTRFVYKNNWFVLSQTDGAQYEPEPTPDWDEARAMAALSVERIPFDSIDGNCQGYARQRQVAVSPVAFEPRRTLFHELAHVVLGHTAEGSLNSDGAERTPRDIRELEAECVAMLCCASLGLPGVEFSRGYVQSWFHGNEVPERSAQKIFHAADQILKSGREVRS